MQRRLSLLLLTAIGMLTLQAGPARAGIIVVPTIHTVGSDGPCDYNNLQDAIDDAATGDTIRVQAIDYIIPTGISITNKSLTVVGGFTDCADDTADPAAPTTITISGVDTALTVGNIIAGVQNVLVRNFVLRSGTGGANKGGGVDLSGGVTLRLDNVDVYDNSAQFGGGIRIHGGPPDPTLRLEGGSLIGGTAPFVNNNNATQNGGGIYCFGGGKIEWADASINFNTAFAGGGLFLQDCELTTPSFTGNDLRMTEIRGNSVLENGGGMVLVSSQPINLSSQPNRQVRIIGNTAEESGGGIHATGSDLKLYGVQIEENTAVAGTGGGAWLSFTQFLFSRGNADGSNCPLPPRCATFRGNVATTFAGAIRANNATLALLENFFLESNRASSIPAILLSQNSNFLIRNVQIAGNVATNPANTGLFYATSATLTMRHITTALNDVHFGFLLDDGAELSVSDSILWQPSVTMVDGDGTETLDLSCNNASESATFPGAANHDPGFRSTQGSGRNLAILRLAANSQNIDRCDLVPALEPTDLNGSNRVTDVAGIVNGAGPLDRGAYEFEPPLFADGFED